MLKQYQILLISLTFFAISGGALQAQKTGIGEVIYAESGKTGVEGAVKLYHKLPLLSGCFCKVIL